MKLRYSRLLRKNLIAGYHKNIRILKKNYIDINSEKAIPIPKPSSILS